MSFYDRFATLTAWAVTMPARRFFFKRKDLRDVEFPSEDGVMLRGWLSDVDNARGTVVIGHGYRDDRRQLLALAPALAVLGLRALFIDFRAHGRSEGSRITIGVEEARDVRASLQWAGALGGPVSYVGFSMGAAAYLLSGVEAHCAVIDSPYDTLTEAIAVRGAIIRASDALLQAFHRANEVRCEVVVEQVRPIDTASRLQRPTLFVFARGDAWVTSETRERYRSAMSTACELVEVEGPHDGHFHTAWILHVARFLEKHA